MNQNNDQDMPRYYMHDAVFQKAGLIARNGNEELAVAIFSKAIQDDPAYFSDPQNIGRHQEGSVYRSGRHNNYDPVTTRAYYLALAQNRDDLKRMLGVDMELRTARGPADMARVQSMEAILEEAWAAHETGQVAEPEYARSLFVRAPGNVDFAELRVAFLGLRHFRTDESFIEYDLTMNVLQSLRCLGAKAELVSIDQLQLGDDDDCLVRGVSAFAPDVLIIDGTATPYECEPVQRLLAQYRSRQPNHKVVVMYTDLYPPRINDAEIWGAHADLMVSFQETVYSEQHYPCPLLIAPSMPYDTSLYGDWKAPLKKDIDLLYIGSRSRMRDCWLSFAEETDNVVHVAFTNRSQTQGYDSAGYAEMHCRAKTVFNNGPVDHTSSINTGRFFEAVLGRAVVLQQKTPQMEKYFTPYLHYVPVETVAELCAWTSFFAQRADWQERISNAARTLYDHCYNEPRFWEKVFSSLDP